MHSPLSFRETGSGQPLIILHGLFGSAINWRRIGDTLKSHWRVVMPDLPNHGNSPWSDDMSYPAQAQILKNFIVRHDLSNPVIVGHSMGGKVAMALALSGQCLINRLVIVDIAPVSYPHSHLELIQAMRALPLAQISTRHDADQFLAPAIPASGLRQFLLQNLIIESRQARWRINLPIIEQQMTLLTGFPFNEENFDVPTLFLHGSKSDYLSAADLPIIKKFFPQAVTQSIDDASHWLHVERPTEVARAIQGFLKKSTY